MFLIVKPIFMTQAQVVITGVCLDPVWWSVRGLCLNDTQLAPPNRTEAYTCYDDPSVHLVPVQSLTKMVLPFKTLVLRVSL